MSSEVEFEVAPKGQFIRAKQSHFAVTESGVDVFKFTVEAIGPDVEGVEEEEDLLLVPDAITVEMPWDKNEHLFHETQVLASILVEVEFEGVED